MKKLSSRELAQILLDNPSTEYANKVARYLSSPGVKVRPQEVTRSLEMLAAANGHVVAHVSSAYPATQIRNDVVKAVKHHTAAHTVEMVTTHNPDLIGGCTIRTPGLSIDTSITNQLRSI